MLTFAEILPIKCWYNCTTALGWFMVCSTLSFACSCQSWDFLVNLSAGYINKPVGDDKWRSLWVSRWNHSFDWLDQNAKSFRMETSGWVALWVFESFTQLNHSQTLIQEQNTTIVLLDDAQQFCWASFETIFIGGAKT